MNYFLILFSCLLIQNAAQVSSKECSDEINEASFSKYVIPALEGKHKGENGKIGVIGGSVEYTGAPYFAAIAALKAGADLVYVITTESAAPVIKSYSPELIVYPLLRNDVGTDIHKITDLISKMHVVIIGPGLGREEAMMSLLYVIINHCRTLAKPLVIDADGLYAVSKNVEILMNYPSPGVILTPNQAEAEKLKKSVESKSPQIGIMWFSYWGPYVSVLVKGKEDTFYSYNRTAWKIAEGGSGRRAGGQGDILAGALATFYKWSIDSYAYGRNDSEIQLIKVQEAKSIAANIAAHFTRRCNQLAFKKYGRSMTASDMLEEIHNVFDIMFNYC